MSIQSLTIEEISFKEEKSGNSKGKQWTMYPVGIKAGDKWYNASFFKKEEKDFFESKKTGDKVDVLIFQEEYNGKMYDKFKMPTESQLLEIRVKKLELFARTVMLKYPDIKEEFNKKMQS